ncbi:DsbA family protein [Patescibacteria group bacterium]|nr:DsbA family protein [Patescibacteria group bacterium]MDQ5919670.1 hypothetical protein [Patescibacteria group bacterium]
MDNSRSQGFWDGSPKVMFLMGLFLGVAVCATVGLGLVFGGVVSGGSSSGVALNPGNVPAVGAPTPQPSAPVGAPVKAVTDKEFVKGNKNAKVTLIEYSDFECPFCKRFVPTVEQALKDFPNDVRVVYRHFPLRSIHPNAQKAGEAAECAGKLGGGGKFWEMHDKLFAAPSLTVDGMKAMAKEIGLDQGKFNTCLDNNETAEKVNADFNEGGASGVEGTPATFVNGTLVSGAIPYDGPGGLKEAIQQAGAQK